MKAVEAQSEQRRLSREQFLQTKIRQEEVEIPGLGGTVLLQSVSHSVRRRLREEASPKDAVSGEPRYDDDLFTKLYIAESIIDPELTLEDVERLDQMNSVVFDQIIMAITLFNTTDAVAQAKKDSSTSPSSGSPSDSASDSATA